MKILGFVFGLSLVVGSVCGAQTTGSARSSKETPAEPQPEVPSEKEFLELLAKADEKVSVFEAALKLAKPGLDRIDPQYAINYSDAASTAHLLISQTTKNGPTAYRLVGVLVTLDDLSLDAAHGTAFLLASDRDKAAGKGPSDPNVLTVLQALSAAGTSCNDIAELLFHATMRLIAAEETALSKLSNQK